MRPGREPNVGRVPKATYYRGRSASGKSSVPQPAKRTGRRGKKLLDWLILIMAAALLAYSLMLKSEPKLKLNSQAYHKSSVYQTAANQASAGIKNKNKITYDEKSIIAKLERQFPEISRASITVPIVSQRPVINLHIDKPVFALSSLGQSFIIDETGVVVPKGSINTAGLILIKDTSGVPLKAGDRLLSASNITFMQQVLAQLEHAKVAVATVDLPPLAQEFDLHAKDSAYFVKFYFGGDPLVESGQMIAARQDFAKKGITPSQYLDVRVAGKIYYK